MYKNSSFQVEQKIKSLLTKIGVLPNSQTLIIGLSGGADSMCITYILHKLGYKLIGAHINFKLRGIASDQDEKFVNSWCAKKGIEMISTAIDAQSIAAKNKEGLEETARKLRYAWFGAICKQKNVKMVVTGHHLNDQAELILMNLIRGMGLDGAKGMLFHSFLPYSKPDDNLILLRPLLSKSKDEIYEYLRSEKIEFRIDETNKQNVFTRNKIRNLIIPEMEYINPNTIYHIAEFGNKVQALLPFFEKYISILKKKVITHTKGKIRLQVTNEINEYTLYYLLSPFGFNEDTVKLIFGAVLHQKKGKKFISKSHEAIIDKQSIDIINLTPQTVLQEIESMPFSVFHWQGEIRFKKCSVQTKPSLSQSIIDSTSLTYPLTIRTWVPGDRMKPLGMKGKTKKIKDILTDHKISGADKKAALVLIDKKEIIWLYPTHTISEEVKCSKTTKNFICIEVF